MEQLTMAPSPELGKTGRSTPTTASSTVNAKSADRRALCWRLAMAAPVVIIPLTVLFAPATPYFWQTTTGVLLLVTLLAAAVTDAVWMRIPNWITYTAVLWGLAVNVFAGFATDELVLKLGAVGITNSLLGGVVSFGCLLVIFSLTGGGAGDVKLTAAIGVFLGLSMALEAILCSFICAGGFALLRAVWVQGPWQMAETVFRAVASYFAPHRVLPPTEEQRALLKSPMPLAPAFAIGTAAVVFQLVPRELFL